MDAEFPAESGHDTSLLGDVNKLFDRSFNVRQIPQRGAGSNVIIFCQNVMRSGIVNHVSVTISVIVYKR
jgi:hypothetical protein